MMAAKRKPKNTVERPYETDYSGAWPGHAKTLEGAIIAAHKRLVHGQYRRCTVTGPQGTEARLTWTPMGVMTWSPGIVKNRKLKSVK